MVTKLFKVEDVAELFDVSEERVYALAREGILPVVKIGRQLRFAESAIDDFVANGGKSWPGGWRKTQ